MNLFYDDYKIDKPLRLIELFAGYGSQAMAFDRIGMQYTHHFVCEFDKYAMASYNAVHGTNFEPTDIREIHGSDLNITETDKFCYFMTYSFPCTDLSVAGKMAGMKKGSGTRSGLLWEVERLLNECDELPQILFMENVPQVISEQNMPDFEDWLKFLHKKGYSSVYKVLNAKDYGVPQNRERCFMFSFLGDFDYEFPGTQPLTKRLKDVLEDHVDEKYYLKSEKAQKLIDDLIHKNLFEQEGVQSVGNINPSGHGINGNVYAGDLAPTLTTNKGEGVIEGQDRYNDVIPNIKKYGNKKGNYKPFDKAISYPMHSRDFVRTGFYEIAPTLSSRDFKDPKWVLEENK